MTLFISRHVVAQLIPCLRRVEECVDGFRADYMPSFMSSQMAFVLCSFLASHSDYFFCSSLATPIVAE